MKVYLHLAGKSPIAGTAGRIMLQQQSRLKVKAETLKNSPLSQAASQRDPSEFLTAFYDWAQIRWQVVEIGAGYTTKLPYHAHIHSFVFELYRKCLKDALEGSQHEGLLGNLSHLPQQEGPLSENSCDLVYWHSEMLGHLANFDATSQAISRLASNRETLKAKLAEFTVEEWRQIWSQHGLSTGRLGPEDLSENAFDVIFDEFDDLDALFDRVQGTAAARSLQGIYRILQGGCFFVETDPKRDAFELLQRFSSEGAVFSEAHFVVPEDQDCIWALVFKK